ncbi:MAG: prepilin-type N-terminal cleavage/methylation domain-containing protein, partial [Gammaproteobacteria bacterium]|nr:prepilin-type N-terminal cleavage/methylation domain-containing protein [Gammaproteobacteria bacterium]
MRAHQSGFTLIELAVSTVILGMMVGVIYKSLGPMLSWKSRADTENRMALLKGAFETAYRQNMVSIDGDAQARLNFAAAGNIDPVLPNGNGYCVPPDN